MDELQRDILKVIKGALKDAPETLSPDFSLQEAAKLASKHQIMPIFYYGASACGFSQDHPIMQKLFLNVCKDIAVSTQQIHSLGRLFSAFDQEKIDYMPLKGTLLKKLYPKSEMRLMGDVDILIKPEQYDKIAPIMKSLNYSLGVESDHEIVWKKPMVFIELHKRLIPSYNKDYYSYFGDGWRLAKLCECTRFSMTDEDQMIYLFTHFAKHYRDSGIGIKHMLDLWIFRNSRDKLDEVYITEELKKLQLLEFYQNIVDTLKVWFENGEPNERTELITSIIFNSGVYGTYEASLLSDAFKKTKFEDESGEFRKKKLFRAIFLPYKNMCEKYPFLEKAAVLLPFMWVVRIIGIVLFKRETIVKHTEDYKTTSSEQIADYGKALNFVGLDFNFKE